MRAADIRAAIARLHEYVAGLNQEQFFNDQKDAKRGRTRIANDFRSLQQDR